MDLSNALGGGARIFGPSNYMIEREQRALSATTVGTLSVGHWQFFAQVYWTSRDIAIRGEGAMNRNERRQLYVIREVKTL